MTPAQRLSDIRKTRRMTAGEKYGLLTTVSRVDRPGQYWLCACSCGRTKIASRSNLRCGTIRSCGCMSRIWTTERKTSHGMSRAGAITKEWHTWASMRQRCQNPKNSGFPSYGGRGIVVCERWHKFENFLADMGNKPSPKHSLDRIDNDGPYAPDNCRWATAKEQERNKRYTIRIEFRGRVMSLHDVGDEIGVNGATLRVRYLNGDRGERLIRPIRGGARPVPSVSTAAFLDGGE